ncbi:hypothetical protein [Schaalia sp. ZJ1691]|nr:hypothetical protein [Schaalia sp. ZJ1691]
MNHIELMAFGCLLDLVDCWLIDTGRAQPARHYSIYDIAPVGI